MMGSCMLLMCAQLLLVAMLVGCKGQWSPPASVVDDDDCTAEQHDSTPEGDDIAVWLNITLPQDANNTACTTALQNLTSCKTAGTNHTALDTRSLPARQECCSRTCATAFEKALITSGPSCYRGFLEAVCNSTHNNFSLAQPLFDLLQRCLGVNASCAALTEQQGSLLPPELEATASSSSSSADDLHKAPPSVLNIPVPDPFQLVPQTASSVVLATPDEIEQAAAAAARKSPQTNPGP